MKCPHCGYEDGWNHEQSITIEGNQGGFYKNLEVLFRRNILGRDERKLYGCPNCMKTFIDRGY